ncbi:hypothetical protein IAU60_006841 [Kwoniella sp. DSM 27419]
MTSRPVPFTSSTLPQQSSPLSFSFPPGLDYNEDIAHSQPALGILPALPVRRLNHHRSRSLTSALGLEGDPVPSLVGPGGLRPLAGKTIDTGHIVATGPLTERYRPSSQLLDSPYIPSTATREMPYFGHLNPHPLDSFAHALASDDSRQNAPVQVAPTTVRRFHSNHAARSISQVACRQRSASGGTGQGRHSRCLSDCIATDVPYHMLSTVIGRASVNSLRTTLVKAEKRKIPPGASGAAQDNDIEMQDADAHRSQAVRPNIQTRRSKVRSYDRELALQTPPPLYFDRKWLESASPLPPVELNHRDVPVGGDFFGGTLGEHGSEGMAGTGAIPSSGGELGLDVDMPRSSSAPAVPLLAESHVRGLSESSAGSTDTDALGIDQRIGLGVINPSAGIQYGSSAHQQDVLHQRSTQGLLGSAASRFSSFRLPDGSARRHEPGSRPHSMAFDQLVGDPTQLSSYLGDELAATLRQRLTPDLDGDAPIHKRKDQVLTETEWSFDAPLSKWLGEIVGRWVAMIPDRVHYNLVEYGCQKETPSALLADLVRPLSRPQQALQQSPKVINVTHQCDADFDARRLQANLATQPGSYQKIRGTPPPLILTSFSLAGFTETVFPPDSVDLGICTGDLSRIHGSISPRPVYSFTSRAEDRASRAEKDLVEWLETRAREFKSGGILAFCFAIRTDQTSSSSVAGRVQQAPESRGYGIQGRMRSPLPQTGPIGQGYSASLPTSPRTSLDGNLDVNMDDFQHPYFRPSTALSDLLHSPPNTERKRRYRPDVWQAMSHALSPAVQRLVSLGEIKTHVAPLLVDVPYWPRTLASMRGVLGGTQDWDVLTGGSVEDDSDHRGFDHLQAVNKPDFATHAEEGRGAMMARSSSVESQVKLDEHAEDAYTPQERAEWADAGVRIERLTHPAWRAFREGKIDRSAYARRIAAYCRSMYEGHLRKVLREKGRMDISQCETTVQELFKVLVEKCELGVLDALEMDMGVVVLRRK